MVMNNAHDVTLNYNIPVKQGVTLEPFLHQVSGSATMMCLNETTVCKPLIYREHFFYKSLPPDIMQFTPQFKGVVNVNIEETPDGNITLTAYPYESESEAEETSEAKDDTTLNRLKHDKQDQTEPKQIVPARKLSHSPCKRIRLKRTGSLCVDGVLDDEPEYSQDENVSKSVVVNPWIFKVHKEGLKRHLRSSNKVVKKCILLENVASQFRRPCVLDLKMGTRVYGDDDDDDKKLRQEKKCAATTTRKLGFRLSGMQVFNSSSKKFQCRDKYYGRTLDAVGLRSALYQFFHDGNRIRHELLVPVLERLRSIRSILEQLRTYRFYSSSLLIMYDGDSSMPTETDFERSLRTGSNGSHIHNEISLPLKEPFLLPEANYKNDKFTSTDSDDKSDSCSPSCEEHCLVISSSSSSIISRGDELKSSASRKITDSTRVVKSPRDPANQVHVDIRMIDFAKSTHRDMDSTVVHDGPDHGYIFGLTNLINILKEFHSSAPVVEHSVLKDL